MKNERLEGAKETTIALSPKTTAEFIPEPTARLVKKSFAQNTIRNRKHALQKFGAWLQGRPITDGLLAEYITHLCGCRGKVVSQPR